MITLVCIPKFWFSSKIRDLIYHVGVGFLEISNTSVGKNWCGLPISLQFLFLGQ